MCRRLKRFDSLGEHEEENGRLLSNTIAVFSYSSARNRRDTNRLEGEIEPRSLLVSSRRRPLESNSEDSTRVTSPYGNYFPESVCHRAV